jgi:2-keto-3-deoxy-L-rhamnonate aldolase RhmA
MIFNNRVKQKPGEGKIVRGPKVSQIRTPETGTLFAQAGLDFFFIDIEPSPFTMETVNDMAFASRASGI